MARISGVDLPRDKRVEIGLTYIYGIGRKTAEISVITVSRNIATRRRHSCGALRGQRERCPAVKPPARRFRFIALLILGITIRQM